MGVAGSSSGLGLWAYGLLLGSVVGCGAPRMAVPEELDDVMDELVTDGRKKSPPKKQEEGWDLGPYQIRRVQWQSSESFDISEAFKLFDNFTPDPQGGYRFKFKGGGDQTLIGKCSVPAPERAKEVDGSVTVTEVDALACSCWSGDDHVSQVYVEDLAGEWGGPVLVGTAEARATAIYESTRGEKFDEPAGYRVDTDDDAVGAVEVVPGKARLWLRHNLEEPDRRRLACVLVGLMLYGMPEQGSDAEDSERKNQRVKPKKSGNGGGDE